MVTEKDIVKFISRKLRTKVILLSLTLLFFPFMFSLPFFHLNNVRIEYIIVLVSIGLLFTLVVDGFIIKIFLRPAIQEYKNPLDEPIFRSFKNPARLADAINEANSQASIYEQGPVRLTEKYIYNKSDYRSIARLHEVRELRLVMDPKDTEGTALMVVDCHQHSTTFSVSGDRNAARHLGDLVQKHCPDISKNGLEQPSEVVKI